MTKDLPKGFNFKKRYDWKCQKCGKELWFAPSFCMQMGINSGHGSCPDCKTFHHLEIDTEKQIGVSVEWEAYMLTQGKKKGEDGMYYSVEKR